MKKLIIPVVIGVSTITLLSGCVLSLDFGGGKKESSSTTSNSNTTSSNPHPTVVQQTVSPTVGQQLMDLKKAKDAGAITEAEYEAQKAKLLNQK